MATYTLKLFKALSGLLSTGDNNKLLKASGGSAVPSLLTDDGTTLKYNSKAILNEDYNRKKSEVYYSGQSVLITDGTSYNLINLLKVLTPTTGALSPFFVVADNKLHVINDNSSLLFKLNITGNWSSAASSRYLQLDFSGTNGNRLVASRTQTTTGDTITLATFLSVDKGGNLATNGCDLLLKAVGGNFTITNALLVAEQVSSKSL